jgi:hypothetical protein
VSPAWECNFNSHEILAAAALAPLLHQIAPALHRFARGAASAAAKLRAAK